MTSKPPSVAQQLLDQEFTAAARLSVQSIVCRHDGFDLRLFHDGFERGKVAFEQILLGGHSVEFVAQGLWAAVDGEVLGASRRFQKPWMIALEPSDEGDSHTARQVGVFTVSFLSAPPARVPQQVDVGRPERQPSVAIAIVESSGTVE